LNRIIEHLTFYIRTSMILPKNLTFESTHLLTFFFILATDFWPTNCKQQSRDYAALANRSCSSLFLPGARLKVKLSAVVIRISYCAQCLLNVIRLQL